MNPIHPSAAQGFAIAAEAYARGRPGYPAELSGWLDGTLGLRAGRTCVDLGAGTGKFTRLLLATGAEVLAVEPVAEMRGQLAADLPAVRALDGTAEALPLADGSADAVLCAQSFHWFANSRALEEIHRVLKPGGRLGLVWNVRDETVAWVAALTELFQTYEGDSPRYRSGQWRLPFNGRFFSGLEEMVFPYEHVGSPQQVIVDRSLSVSFIAALPAGERARVEERLLALVAGHPDLRGRENVAFPYRTHAYHCMRLKPYGSVG